MGPKVNLCISSDTGNRRFLKRFRLRLRCPGVCHGSRMGPKVNLCISSDTGNRRFLKRFRIRLKCPGVCHGSRG